MDFSWTLSETTGLNYEVVITSLDGSEEYYRSGRLTDGIKMSASFLDLSAMKRGEKYHWFLRAGRLTANHEQSAGQEFYYDPALRMMRQRRRSMRTLQRSPIPTCP